MMIRLVIISLLLGAFLTGCSNSDIFRESVNWETGSWALSDTVSFDVELEDTTRLMDLSLDVLHDPDFAYQNLYVKVYTIFPDGSEKDQVLSLQLADKTGQWLGTCGSSSCRTTVLLSDAIRVPQSGSYRFSFVQYSREDSLSGIQGLSFAISDHKKAG